MAAMATTNGHLLSAAAAVATAKTTSPRPVARTTAQARDRDSPRPCQMATSSWSTFQTLGTSPW